MVRHVRAKKGKTLRVALPKERMRIFKQSATESSAGTDLEGQR